MKKLYPLGVVITFVMVIAAAALAAPFIVSDPQPEAQKFRMRLSADNGVTWGAWVEGVPVGNALRFDIAGTPKGTYLGEAQAGADVELTDSTTGQVSTVWQWSPSAPFVLKVRAGQKVANIRVVD